MNGIGLMNCGNSCYFNAALQLLGMVDGLHRYIDTGKWEKDINDLIILYKGDEEKMKIMQIVKWWTSLQVKMHRQENNMQEKRVVANPSVIRAWMGTKDQVWLSHHQQDSQEALGFLIDMFTELMGLEIDMEFDVPESIRCDSRELELHRKAWQSWVNNYAKKYSIWTELFFGQEHILCLCANCGNRNDQFDPFLFTFLNVDCLRENHPDFDGHPSWRRPFIHKFRKEPPQEDYKCEKCEVKGQTYRGLKLWRAPYYMMTVWKSFMGNDGVNASSDLLLPKVGEELDFSEWVEYEAAKVRYRLLGWINHLGNLNGGHYRTVRVPSEEWGQKEVVIDDDVLVEGHPEKKYPGRAYVGLWKRVDTSIENSDFWEVS